MPMDVAIVDPEKELWSGEADFVVARSADGEIGILPGHAPFLGVLKHARLKVEAGGDEIIFAVHGGFIEMKDNRLSVLARRAEISSDIDVARAATSWSAHVRLCGPKRRARTRSKRCGAPKPACKPPANPGSPPTLVGSVGRPTGSSRWT